MKKIKNALITFWQKYLFPALYFVYAKILKPIGKTIYSFIKRVWGHKRGRIGLIMIIMIILVAIFAPLLTPYGLLDYDTENALLYPSWQHWLGTNENGIDIMTQVLYGTRVSLMIGLITGITVTILGAILGVIAGYYGKVASGIILNVINVLMVIPTLPLMILLNKVSSSYIMMIFIFVIFGWAGTARIVRAQTLSIINMNYVKQAELAGASKWYVLKTHIMPAVSHLLIMNAALGCAGFMIAEAGLSFIGLGDPNATSWGKVLVAAESYAFTFKQWAWVIAPGVAIFISVTAFMNIGYAMEDIFNPKMCTLNQSDKIFKSLTNDDIEKAFDDMNDLSIKQAQSIYKASSDADKISKKIQEKQEVLTQMTEPIKKSKGSKKQPT